MRGTRAATALVFAALGIGALAACDDPEATPPPAAQVVEAVVRDVAAEVTPDAEDPERLPVIYVVSGSDDAFSAQTQANVAAAVNEVVDLRFADDRDESIDSDGPGSPVRDGGVLIQIGKLLEDDSPMMVDVEVYRSTTQFSRRVITFRLRGDEWATTDDSVLEAMDVSPTTEGPATEPPASTGP